MASINIYSKGILLLIILLISGFSSQGQQNWEWTRPSNEENTVSVILMADMNIQNRKDPSSGFIHIMPTLHQGDVLFCNLEGPFAGTSSDVIDIPHKSTWTHSDPAMVEGLVEAGFDAVGVANNVTYPYSALMRSLKVLDKAGIKHTGGGKNISSAIEPVIIEEKGTKIGFVQYAATVFPFNHVATKNQPGIAEIKVHTSYQAPPNLDKPAQPPVVLATPDEASLASMVTNISALKEKVDIVVASYHWGVSSALEPHAYQRIIGRAAIEAGADIVLGHGAHKLQTIEMWKDRPIFYCAGNAVFDWWKIRSSPNGLLIRAVVKDKKLDQVSFVPLQRDDDNAPILYDPSSEMGQKLISRIDGKGGLHRARLNIQGKEVVIYDAHAKESIPRLEKAWQLDGFSFPECAVYDKKRNRIYIGNMGNGNPDDGYISTIKDDGTIEKMLWLTGLNDPKGMDLQEDTLWVNDINQIVKIDVIQAKVIARIKAPDVVALNDLAVSPDGYVFSNDADGHKMYRIKNGEAKLYWRDLEQGRPNGVWAEKDRLLVATSNSHQLLSVSRGDRKPTLLSKGLGRGDGIEALADGGYLITDYGGRIFYFSPDEFLHTLHDSRGTMHTADLEYIAAKRLLVVPAHRNNVVQAFHLIW
ncbi:MAG: hypothetical protein HKN87_15990 [Saprospiraceae bacterium]|nr:hypothetical protein [Saprospiraceae bacterium]